jgi:hypothetical protein
VRIASMPRVDVTRLGSLVSTVAANLAADTHRHRARGDRLGARLADAFPPAAGPDERVCDTAEAAWLWRRRAELNEQDRAVLELRTAGLTVAQAASALGITYKAAESAFTRARARMRQAWASTLGVLGWLGVQLRRSLRPAALAAAAAGLMVLVPALAPPAAPRPPASPRLAVTSPATTSRAGTRSPRRTGASAARTRPPGWSERNWHGSRGSGACDYRSGRRPVPLNRRRSTSSPPTARATACERPAAGQEADPRSANHHARWGLLLATSGDRHLAIDTREHPCLTPTGSGPSPSRDLSRRRRVLEASVRRKSLEG